MNFNSTVRGIVIAVGGLLIVATIAFASPDGRVADDDASPEPSAEVVATSGAILFSEASESPEESPDDDASAEASPEESPDDDVSVEASPEESPDDEATPEASPDDDEADDDDEEDDDDASAEESPDDDDDSGSDD